MADFETVLTETLGEIDFDPQVLKARYLAERDKRLRGDANDQYIEVTGDFSGFVDDPYAASIERDPDAWVAEMQSKARFGARFRAECTPGYYNNEGGVENPNGFFSASYGAGPVAFFDLLTEWRERGDLVGCRIS